MAVLTPTSAYLHSVFDSPRTNACLRDTDLPKSRLNESDVFAAAFNLAADCLPRNEDEKHIDPFNIFCQIPSPAVNHCPATVLELSPPQSAGFNFFENRDVHDDFADSDTALMQTQSSNLPTQQHSQYHPPPPPPTLPPSQLHQEFPPTPATQTYTSPYSNPSPSTSHLPPPLKPRRRGPKPKSLNAKSKEEKDEIHKRFLERNKQAAKRCRERKKLGIEATQKLLREQEREVAALQCERDYLMLEIESMKGLLEGCTCEKRGGGVAGTASPFSGADSGECGKEEDEGDEEMEVDMDNDSWLLEDSTDAIEIEMDAEKDEADD